MTAITLLTYRTSLMLCEMNRARYIGTHAVAHHLREAFCKLSITSRVELARIVIEPAADGAPLRN